MKKVRALAAALAIVALTGAAGLVNGCKNVDSDAQGTAAVHKYTCPMHPEVVQDSPGKCPKCGMDLVRKD